MDKKTYYANKRENFHAERERRAQELRRKEIDRDIERAKRQIERDRALRISRNRERSSTIARGFGGVGSRFIGAVSSGISFKSIVIFFCLFCIISQLLINPNVLNGSALDDRGFISEEFRQDNFDAYNYFYSFWTTVEEENTVSTEMIFSALNNYTSISIAFDRYTFGGTNGFSIGGLFSALGFESVGFLLNIDDAINSIGRLLKRIVEVVVMLGNTIYLLFAILYTAFSVIMIVLGLLNIKTV
ncbi:MAG: hypothetical protein IKB98_04065 [Clostridia bacterium]|nr:hypothetical protein [Clostridia bacterium]